MSINPLIYPDLKDRIVSLTGGTPLSSTGASANSGSAISSANNLTGSDHLAPVPGKINNGQSTNNTGAAGGTAKGNNTVGTVGAVNGEDLVKNLNSLAEIENKLRNNDLEGAQKLASALVEKDPHNGKAWLMLGRIDEKKGRLR